MRILFTSPWFPFPAVNGSKIRISYLVRALAHGHDVSLISFVREGEIVDVESAKAICKRVEIVPWREFTPNSLRALIGFFSPQPRAVFDTWQPEMSRKIWQSVETITPDIVISSETATASYLRRGMTIPSLAEDVELGVLYDAGRNSASLLRRLRHRLTWEKHHRYMRRLLERFGNCTVVSERERALVRSIAPGVAVSVLPNGVDTKALNMQTETKNRNQLIFNGALTYSANFDAMKYFLAEIFPRIYKVKPSVRLQITGSYEGVPIERLNLNENVELTGFLDDIHGAVAHAAVCVVPLRIGGGTRLKILEAMALGTPVVSTSKGAEGLEVTSGENIIIADDEKEFAEAVLRLLEDVEYAAQIARNARQLVEEKYDWHRIGKQFVALVENMVNE